MCSGKTKRGGKEAGSYLEQETCRAGLMSYNLSVLQPRANGRPRRHLWPFPLARHRPRQLGDTSRDGWATSRFPSLIVPARLLQSAAQPNSSSRACRDEGGWGRGGLVPPPAPPSTQSNQSLSKHTKGPAAPQSSIMTFGSLMPFSPNSRRVLFLLLYLFIYF